MVQAGAGPEPAERRRNKYTEREKEMLVGCARVPSAFFSGKSGLGFGKIAMVVLIAGVAGVAAWKSRED